MHIIAKITYMHHCSRDLSYRKNWLGLECLWGQEIHFPNEMQSCTGLVKQGIPQSPCKMKIAVNISGSILSLLDRLKPGKLLHSKCNKFYWSEIIF